MKYFLQPMNEGQELNYVESRNDDFSRQRARIMQRKLQEALPQGDITIDIFDKDFNELGYVDNNNFVNITKKTLKETK